MNLLEHLGKEVLRDAGIATPRGTVVSTAAAAAVAARELGPNVVLKSQVLTGKRGKAGGIRFAQSPAQAAQEAQALLGAVIGGHQVEVLLVEEAVDIAQELYAAILNDPASKSPMLIFCTRGGMDIEEVNASHPQFVTRLPLDITADFDQTNGERVLAATDLAPARRSAVAAALARLYRLYREVDAELVEVNPLVLTTGGAVLALDAKISLDPGALGRHTLLVQRLAAASPDRATDRERTARSSGLSLLELDGNVGVLANGAGLTMTTLDAVNHYGGRPANFLEIGGDAYTRATPALRVVLSNPAVRSLVVNFCGAFARTDVMTEGVVNAVLELKPQVPIFFSIHGTGEETAIRMVRDRLAVEPYDLMDDAVKAAVEAAALPREVA